MKCYSVLAIFSWLGVLARAMSDENTPSQSSNSDGDSESLSQEPHSGNSLCIDGELEDPGTCASQEASQAEQPPTTAGKYYCADEENYSTVGNLKCFHDTNITGSFVIPDLQPGQVAPILWREDGKRVTEFVFQVGVPEKLTNALLDYCDELGITDLFRKFVTTDPIPPDEESYAGRFFEMNDGNRWYAQRPSKMWKSNMHWISPADEKTHEEYLKVLGKGDFDSTLEAIGTALGLEGLVAYHLTFIGVSHSVKGYVHYDTAETGAGVYNIIIPLIVEEDAPAELIIKDDVDGTLGGYKYQVGAGAMMGDDAMHGTLECDYRETGGMRMAATVYIADISEDNVDAVATQTLTQIFPLADTKWLMAQAARHWGGDNRLVGDRGRKPYRFDDEFNDCYERAEKGMCESDTDETRIKCLKTCNVYIEQGPQEVELIDDKKVSVCVQNRTGGSECAVFEDTDSPGEFIAPKLQPGEMFPIIWREDGSIATKYGFQVGVPPKLTTELLDYCNRLGLTDLMRSLVGPDPIEPQAEHTGKFVELNDGNRWYAQRPAKKWQSNMHWVSPADEKTHEEYLKVLAAGDFDSVLDAIGNYLGLQGLVAYHLTFIGVSHSVKGFMHRDTHNTGASVYNVIIPLILEENAPPELAMSDDNDGYSVGRLKYQIGAAAMMGDDSNHGTEACDYRETGGMRLAATVYIADINSGNVDAIAKQTLTQIFPLADTSWLMAQAGRHWGEGKSLVNDEGRRAFFFNDKLADCVERAARGMCESDSDYTRFKCLRSCKIYDSNLSDASENQITKLEFCFLDEFGEEQCSWYVDSGTSESIIIPELDPGNIFGFHWKEDGMQASFNSFQVALPPNLTTELLNFCKNLGVIELFNSLLRDEDLMQGHEKFVSLNDGNRWHIKRNKSDSLDNNMRLLSPTNEETHEKFLEVLAVGDFGKVIQGIGKFIGLEGMAVYQMAIIGLSHSQEGYTYNDFTGTGQWVYNVIVPLMLNTDSPPKLIITDKNGRVGNFTFQLGSGVMMGEDAIHGMAELDYRNSEEISLAASIFVADITGYNVDTITKQTVSQIFPPPDKRYILAQQKRHYGGSSSLYNDSGRGLFDFEDELGDCPERAKKGMCESDIFGTRFNCLKSCNVFSSLGTSITPISVNDGDLHQITLCLAPEIKKRQCKNYTDTNISGDFFSPILDPGDMLPVIWRNDTTQAHKNLWKVKISSELSNMIRNLCVRQGIVENFRHFLHDSPLEPGHDMLLNTESNNTHWYVQRPVTQEDSNEHWISPADEYAHEHLLKLLAAGNFDQVLASIGNNMNLDSLAVYRVMFKGVSYAGDDTAKAASPVDFSGDKVFSIFIPIMFEVDGPPELIFEDNKKIGRRGELKYEIDVGLMVGDGVKQGNPAFNQKARGRLRILAVIDIADINHHNSQAIADSLTSLFPPPEPFWIAAQAGRHWGGRSSLIKDQGRTPFVVYDNFGDCPRLAKEGKCDTHFKETRKECYKTCKVFIEFPEGHYINTFFDNLNLGGGDCRDDNNECPKLAKTGLCITEYDYMEEIGCRWSCLFCVSPDQKSFFSIGEKQILEIQPDEKEDDEIESPSPRDVAKVIAETEAYIVNELLINDDLRHVRFACRNFDEKCAVWAAQGYCELDRGWMGKTCPAACKDCLMVDRVIRCPIDYDSDAIGPGGINEMFERWLNEAGVDPASFSAENPPNGGTHPLGELTVITSPYHDMANYLSEEEKNSGEEFQPLPWLVAIENFLSEEECDRLIEYGTKEGYERSTGYGDEANVDGTFNPVELAGRTSMNTWCWESCEDDPVVKGIIEKMEKMTGLPYANYEIIQLVRYESGQRYNQHHDYISGQENSTSGPRILTFFLYLNDVSNGGGTEFAELSYTAQPKRGMALVWPSVTDADPYTMDDWTWHEAKPVNEGVKYGANAWIHLRDFRNTPEYC